MKRKGFTLVELLVVIAIIALLMSILMPALAKVREMANRVVCGSNCRGIVQSMLVYANDTDSQKFPIAGPPTTVWADGTNFSANPPQATVTASLYLLVLLDYTSGKNFICKSDPVAGGAFNPADPAAVLDFDDPRGQCSYGYHIPYAEPGGIARPVTPASDPGMVVIADRNPFVAPVDPLSPNVQERGNSESHQYDGQNVALLDASVEFVKSPTVGINGDNIYTIADTQDIGIGTVPSPGGHYQPVDTVDSVVVSQP